MRFLGRYPVDLVSLMDHTPGHRQFRDIDKARVYYGGKCGMSESEFAAFTAERVRLHERNAVAHRARDRAHRSRSLDPDRQS